MARNSVTDYEHVMNRLKEIKSNFKEEEVPENAKEWQLNRKPGAVVKAMLEITVEEVYSITPKPGEAGKRLI